MSYAELKRAMESYNRNQKVKAQEKASYDYILADLIGRSLARVYNASNKFPEIATVYPTLFDSEEIQEQRNQKQAELSALRFRMFANSHNKRFEEVGENK